MRAPSTIAAIASTPGPRWRRASIPAGRWTSYSDVAEVIGSHQGAVGNRLAAVPVANAHRVLKLTGAISPDFRWSDPERQDDPRTLLEAEGVRFDQWGRAAADQRMTAQELADAVGLDTNGEEEGNAA